MPTAISRRTLLTTAAALAAAKPSRAATPERLKLSVFSKHLQFLSGDALAQGAAEIGFDGIDLAVRKGGHIEPERVSQDLPALAASIRAHHLLLPMITTDIVDADTPHAEDILRTMHSLGIRHYRWGGFRYDYAKPLAPQLEACRARAAKLAELNRRYQATAMYHTHSGPGQVGASIWDLHIVLKDLDPDAVAVNYDIGHATIEGGLGGWINSFHITGPYLRGIAVKDFLWAKRADGRWDAQFVPLATGMVHLDQFFQMVKQSGFQGPLQIHYEYPLGGAEHGARALKLSQPEVFDAMRRDVRVLRESLEKAQL